MAKRYLLTEEDFENLNMRLEMTFLRDSKDAVCIGGEPLDEFLKSDLYRKFNYEIRSWMSEVMK